MSDAGDDDHNNLLDTTPSPLNCPAAFFETRESIERFPAFCHGPVRLSDHATSSFSQEPALRPKQQRPTPHHTTLHQPQALHESAATTQKKFDALSAESASRTVSSPLPEAASPPPPAAEDDDTTLPPPRESDPIQVFEPVDYGGLVGRAMSQEEEGLSELRRKAGDAGVVRYIILLYPHFSLCQH